MFWTDADLFRFVKWAADLRSSKLQRVFFDRSTWTGQKTARRAFELYNDHRGFVELGIIVQCSVV